MFFGFLFSSCGFFLVVFKNFMDFGFEKLQCDSCQVKIFPNVSSIQDDISEDWEEQMGSLGFN